MSVDLSNRIPEDKMSTFLIICWIMVVAVSYFVSLKVLEKANIL